MAKSWFAPKRYGYGVRPATWKGWAATGVFVVVFILDIALVHGWPRWVGGAILIGIFAGIACATTEGGCRWR